MSNKSEAGDIPVDLNRKKFYFDGTQIYREVMDDLKKWMKEKAMERAFENDFSQIPIRPRARIWTDM